MIPVLTKDYNLEMAFTKAKCNLACKSEALDCIQEIIEVLCSMKEISYFAVFDKIKEVRKKKYDEWKIASENYDVAWEAYKSDCKRRHKEFDEAWIKEFGEDTLPF